MKLIQQSLDSQINNLMQEMYYQIQFDKNQQSSIISQCQRQNLLNSINKKEISRSIRLFNSNTESSRKGFKLLGGGGCCSKNNEPQFGNIGINFEEVKENKKQNEIDPKFNKFYKSQVENLSHIQSIVEKNEQVSEIIKVCESGLIRSKDLFTINVHMYRASAIQIFNLCLQYIITGAQSIDKDDQNLIFKKLDAFIQHVKQNVELFPCQDLEFIYQFLMDINQEDFDYSNESQKQLQIVSQFVTINIQKRGKLTFPLLVNDSSQINNNQGQDLIQFLQDIAFKQSDSLENIWQIVDRAHQKVKSFTKDAIVRQIVAIWALKVSKLGQNSTDSQDLLFFINQFIELSMNGKSSYLVLYILTQVNYILEKNIQNAQFTKDLIQYFLVDQKFSYFIQLLKQESDKKQTATESFLLFFKFTVTDITYRFLSNQILLNIYNSVIQELLNQNDQLLIHLIYSYATEKNERVKLLFQANKKFVNYVKKMTSSDTKNIAEIVMSYQKKRKEEFQKNKLSKQEIEQIEDNIKDESDFIEKITLKLIEKWELEARQRLEKNISQKDDILLEVQDLYIDQNIEYLTGNDIFNEKDKKVEFSLDKDNKQNKLNAVDLIMKYFLLPNQLEAQNQNNPQTQANKCKIIGILAEGGTGKSMLFKRVETLLMKDKNQNFYTSNEKLNYITLLVKCNNLDSKNPSLDDYLISQGLDQNQIKQLKKMQRNKLILLDGYDEYTGNYFKVYQKLGLQDWTNTLVIVSSRIEKFSQSDAVAYFSIEDQYGSRDNNSYCIAKLKEFERKDIDEYCKKFYQKQSNLNQQIELKEGQFLNMMKSCLNSQQLENLLLLPINLYLFTRMVINKQEQELEDLIKDIQDQIQIQDIFFAEQFNRESLDFMVQINENLSNKQLKEQINSSYFQYFQTLALQMFLNKSFKSNFLQLNREEVVFELNDQIKKMLKKEDQQKLKDKIQNYVNTKIITKVKDLQEEQEEEQQAFSQKILEFKHKSLFEYFVAKAFKYDFDVHKEDIHKMSLQELSKFKINQKIIMNPGINQSEQQILVKLYKLLKKDIDSDYFRTSYQSEDISQNNRYIQYLRKSSISKPSDVSQIDIGASNLLSALFVSKYAYEGLKLTKCSFSQAYIPYHKSDDIVFDSCNFNNAYLESQNLGSFETCFMNNSMFQSFKKEFDLGDMYLSNGVEFYQNSLISISRSGFINSFSIENSEILQQKRISCLPLQKILLQKDKLIAASQTCLFEINPVNLEVFNSTGFIDKIERLQAQENLCLVTLSNEENFIGNFQTGFKQLDLQGKNPIFSKNQIITNNQNQLFIYDLQNYQLQKQINIDSFEKAISSMDGKTLILIQDKTFQVWKSEAGDLKLIRNVEGHTQKILSFEFSQNSKFFVSCSSAEYIIWDISKDFEIIKQKEQKGIQNVKFSSDNKYLAISLALKQIIMSIENNFSELNNIKGHEGIIPILNFSHNDKYLATCSSDKTFKIWDTSQNYKLIKSIQGHQQPIKSIIFSPNDKLLVTIDDNTCKIWNFEKEMQLIQEQVFEDNIDSVAFSPDGALLVIATIGIYELNCNIYKTEKLDLLHKKLTQECDQEDASVDHLKVAFSYDGRYLAASSAYSPCAVFDVKNDFQILDGIQIDGGNASSLAFSPDGKYLAVGQGEEDCLILKVQQNFELLKIVQNSNASNLSFSADSRYLITASQNINCKIWSVEKDFEMINKIDLKVRNGTFKSDNKYFATSCSDGTFQIWNISVRFERINSIQGHVGKIYQAVFSPDNKYLATASSDMTCKIWNVENSFELLYTLIGHQQEVYSVSFSSDGQLLATASDDKVYNIWNVKNSFQLIQTLQNTKNEDLDAISQLQERKVIYLNTSDKSIKIPQQGEPTRKPYNIFGKGFFINTFQHQTNDFSKNSKYFATKSAHELVIYNRDNNFEIYRVIFIYGGMLEQFAFSANSKYFAVATSYLDIIIWDLSNNFSLVKKLSDNLLRFLKIDFSNDGQFFISAFEDGSLKLWNPQKDFEPITTIKAHDKLLSCLTFTSDSKYLFTVSQDKTCKIWDTQNGFSLINTINNRSIPMQFVSSSNNGVYLATSDLQSCKIWNILKGIEQTKALKSKDKIENKQLESCFRLQYEV
ncbi:WD domain, G-beta repeat protein (macronuclear) [Tetrahymena thermophila SB210]|uniref:WD domain, G-beta repeat protein n=1 Tax=Tetrahymena thermophila (strain SB210) TaxID=312017 RepID=Q245S3_TETTS|nr:WD domain, G-beta repeat protein [Tetrahymena thermophila SB210]EAS03560.2 WD domain, G-beta repeat protein [Tetrahymena thermophila SB210]|eukprot:XP_001023805.2 WD domain, G-beta repeat protein [Tetrahymena thermophila SB210]